MLSDDIPSLGKGRVTNGIELNSSIKGVVFFIEKQLEGFSQKIVGEVSMSERVLNDKLCKYLNRKVGFNPFYFHHENVENPSTGLSPQTDIGTLSKEDRIRIGDRSYGEFDSFFSMEAKRLPTPGHNRQKEYVIGHDRSCGGIERFKLGIHGEGLKFAAIIGYVQDKDFDYWFKKINGWINELQSSSPNFWKDSDNLIKEYEGKLKWSKFSSNNYREINVKKDNILLLHYWINLKP